MDEFLAQRSIRIKQRILEYREKFGIKDTEESTTKGDPVVVNVPKEITLFPEDTEVWWSIESQWIGDNLLMKKAPKLSQQDELYVWIRKTEENKGASSSTTKKVKKVFEIPLEKIGDLVAFLIQYYEDSGNPDQNDPDLIFNHQAYGIVQNPSSPEFWKCIFVEERDTEVVFESNGNGIRGEEEKNDDDDHRFDGGNFKMRVFRNEKNEYNCVMWQSKLTKKKTIGKPFTITLNSTELENFLTKLTWYTENVYNGFEYSYILKGFTE